MRAISQSQVHIIDAEVAHATTLKCVRCKRDLPHLMFAILPGSFIDRRGTTKFRPLALHPCCNTCRKQIASGFDGNKHYSPGLDRFWAKKVSSLRQGARTRGVLFAIDKDDVIEQWIAQEGKCALTGMELNWKETGGSVRGHRSVTVPSVDRIDSHANYTKDNIQIVSAVVNVMKNELSERLFLSLCGKVVAHAKVREERREDSYADLTDFFCDPVEERADVQRRLDRFRLK